MASKTFKTTLPLQSMEQRAVPTILLNGNLYITGTPISDVVEVKHVAVDRANKIQVHENGAM